MVTPGKSGGGQHKPLGFPASAREIFLTHLAETANVKASARKAGVCTSAVYRMRRRSQAFRDSWQSALCEGYARIEASLLEQALKDASGKAQDSTLKARDAKNRIRLALLAHHRASVRGEPKAAPSTKGRSKQELTTILRMRLERMRQNVGHDQS